MRRVLAVAVLALAACTPEPDRSPVHLRPPPVRPAPFTPPPELTHVRLGLTPFLAPETMRATHERLAAYLSKQLSVPVEIGLADSYGGVIEGLERNDFDLVELSPYAYAQVTQKVQLDCLAQTIADGTASAAAYIFVRDDSPRRSLDDLAGARVGFVDRHSTSGYLYPMKLFKDRGVDPKSFASMEFLGNHEAVALAVLDGKVDVGATFQGAFSALRRAKGIDPLSFRIIAKTPRTPRDAVCVKKGFPPEAAAVVKRSLLELTSKERAGREILGPLNLNGFVPFDEHSYDEVRKVAAELGGE
jgi:phosphonate transport system substrate-binding protein